MRTRVVSIITGPLRFLRRLFGLLLRLLRTAFKKLAGLRGTSFKGLAGLLGKPFTKLRGLRGKPRIAVVAVLGVVVILAVLALRPGPDADKEVRERLDRYAQASREKDYQTLCDDLLASELIDQIRNAGLPCEVALRTGLETRRNPTLKVLGVEVNGEQALARVYGGAVGEVSGTSTFRLVREDGDWRIATPPGSETQAPGAGP